MVAFPDETIINHIFEIMDTNGINIAAKTKYSFNNQIPNTPITDTTMVTYVFTNCPVYTGINPSHVIP